MSEERAYNMRNGTETAKMANNISAAASQHGRHSALYQLALP